MPILVYHRIGDAEGRWRRTPEGLYADLEQLYEAGFRPVRLRAYLDGRIDLPPGYAPVILTFDDSTADQLSWDEAGTPVPDSAVGVLLRFAADHPGWDATAVFFVNAGPFGSDSEAKVRWLVEQGFEVENHTWSHANLNDLDAAAAGREVGRLSRWIEEATGRAPLAVALPFGGRPADVDPVLAGIYEGHAYRHAALLEVGWGPAPSPFDPDWNPLRLPRIQVVDPGQVSDSDLPSIWATWLERLLDSGDLFAN
ncbi:MAG TPA: polysaccharide deacetylase family protein [Bacillota bacterium]